MTSREFTLWAVFIFATSLLVYYVSHVAVAGETEECATLCGATGLQPVYLPRARACFCSSGDGTLKVPHNASLSQE